VEDPKLREARLGHSLQAADELLATSGRLIAETRRLLEQSRELVKTQAELLASLKRTRKAR
jgi:hypothetical protein